MCSENSRSQIVFRTDIFRKLPLGAPEDYHRGHSDAIIMNLVLNDLCCYIPPCKKGNSDAVFNRSGCFPAKLLNSHATLIRRTKQLRVNVSESQRDQHFSWPRSKKSIRFIFDPGQNATSLRKHPFLVALRRWKRFSRRNVCDSAAEIPY